MKLNYRHAVGVRDGILKGMESVGITPKLLSEKLVGINTDGAVVNLGTKGRAVKLLFNSVN